MSAQVPEDYNIVVYKYISKGTPILYKYYIIRVYYEYNTLVLCHCNILRL